MERRGSGGSLTLARTSSRDSLDSPVGSSSGTAATPDIVKLKDDLRRYREGYDFYKYKFKEAEQWLAKEGLDNFKREHDDRRRRLREMEDAHKKDQQEIETLKVRTPPPQKKIEQRKFNFCSFLSPGARF